MKKIKQISWLIPLVILFMTNISRGQLLTDDFSYTPGTLLTANGWTNHSGTSNFIPVTNGGLTYTGFIGSGIGNAASLLTTGEDVNRAFTAQTGGSVYAACMVNVSASQTTGDYFIHFAESPITGNLFRARVFIKKDPSSTSFAFGINKSSTTAQTVYTGFTYSLNTTYLIVFKYTFNPSTLDDVVSLYINPVINGTEPAPVLTNTSATDADASNLGLVCLRQGTAANAPTLWVDGIRVGTTWNSVVPVVSAASIIVNLTSLPVFTTTVGNASASQFYNVSGTNLTDSIIVTAPSNFEIRDSGIGTFGSRLAYAQSGGTVSQKTIEVRLSASAPQGTWSGNITNASVGATTQNVAVTGAVNILYYNKSGLNLDDVLNWGTDPDGNGTSPSDFTSANQTFLIYNGTNPPMNATWTVSGSYSRVILGDGVNPISFTINSTYAFAGTIDVSALGTLKLQNTTLPTFGTLNTYSTVSFEQIATTVIPARTYGNLKAVGSTKTFASGSTTVLGNLTADAVSNFDGSGTPFSTVNLAGDFSLLNGTYFTSTALNRLTLVCNGTTPQTLMGNGSDFKLFRITVQNPSGVTLASTSNLVLGNASGGGYSLLSGDLQVGDNTLSFYPYGKAIISSGGTGALICAVTSNLSFSTDGKVNLGTLKLKSGFETLNNFTLDIKDTTNALQILTLGSNLTVNGSLNLTKGKILLGSNDLALTISAAPIIGANALNYIITNGTGVLSQYVNNLDTYVSFPVGPKDSSYNPVNIKLDGASTTDAFSVKVSNTITNPPYAPTQVINKEWNISEGTTGGSNATLQFHFGLADFGAAFDTTLSNYDIGHYSSGYTVYGGSISPSANGLFTITSTSAISSFSPFIVGNYNSVIGSSVLNLGLTALIEGFYNGATMTPDTVTVELRSNGLPYTLIESKKVVLSSTGTAAPAFSTAVNGTPYYIVLKHRNAIETWSSTAQTFTGSNLNYDFTSAATQAYGSNMILVGTKWCLYEGDANKDGAVDALDMIAIDNDAANFVTGYVPTDLNGDGGVDALDMIICDNNSTNFVAAVKPPGAPDAVVVPKTYEQMKAIERYMKYRTGQKQVNDKQNSSKPVK
jgi:hypothetical protein